MDHNTIITHDTMLGSIWTIGWLFTIGYLNLNFLKGFFALFIWPYYIGVHYKNKHTA